MLMASFEHDAVVPAAQDGDDKKQQTDHGHGHSHDHSHGHTSAKIVALGTVNVGGATFSIDREGQVEAGAETEFGVELVGSASAVPSAAWLANPDGKKICDPVSAEDHNQHWHFTVAPLYPVKKSKFVLQVGGEEVSVDWHRGAEPCHGVQSCSRGLRLAQPPLLDGTLIGCPARERRGKALGPVGRG